MQFLKFLKSIKQPQQSAINSLQAKLQMEFPDKNERELLQVACYAGLLARIAYADLSIQPGEVKQMELALNQLPQLNESEVKKIVHIAIEDMQNLSGIENHSYTAPLAETLSEKERYNVLVSLFKVAAGDGEASLLESEEIRLVSKGLLLNDHHYLAARATVLDYLKVLKA